MDNPVSDDFAYSRWMEVEAAGAAAPIVPLEDDCVLMLHPVKSPAFYTILTITCGDKQVQTCLEPTTFDPPRSHAQINPSDVSFRAAVLPNVDFG